MRRRATTSSPSCGACVDAIAAGALGISTGRHDHAPHARRRPGARHVRGGTRAVRIGAPTVEQGAGILQVIPFGAAGEAAEGFDRDLALVRELLRGSAAGR
jgi:hypothetical protein